MGLFGFMGSEVLEELALEGGDSELVLPGGGVGVVLFWAATFWEDRRLEPLTRFLKRAFMDDMKEEGQGEERRWEGRERKGGRGGVAGVWVSWQAEGGAAAAAE